MNNCTTICPLPWNHISIQQNGDFRICCQQVFEPYGKMISNGEVLNIKNSTIDTARNHPTMKEVRASMLAGQEHPLCKLCYKDDALGLSSKRKHMLQWYNTSAFHDTTTPDGTIDTSMYPVVYFDIRFGNLCNLKCRYCGPADSSLWYEDFVKLVSDNDTTDLSFYGSKTYTISQKNNKWDVNSTDFEWYDDENFWTQIEKIIPFTDRYYFTGGEPTINKSHFRLIELIIKLGHSKNVVLEYNSNMVAVPNKLYEYWQEFRTVNIAGSVDGIGDMATYLRPPAKWSVIEANLNTLGMCGIDSVRGSVQSTISVYNVLHFLDIVKWLSTKQYSNIKAWPGYHMLEGPEFMNIQVLPMHLKLFVKQKYDEFFDSMQPTHNNFFRLKYSGIIAHMFNKDLSESLPLLKLSTTRLDSIRNQTMPAEIEWLRELLV